MKWPLILFLFYSFLSQAQWAPVNGPPLKERQEIFHSIIDDLEKINLVKEIYMEPYRGIDAKWMEKFGMPFAMKMGRFFKLENLLVNLNLVGFYKIPFGYPLGEYALKAQLSIPLP
jgi:hypothetical protein